jgi:hypothetical protein
MAASQIASHQAGTGDGGRSGVVEARPRVRRRALFTLDAGWLFVVAGLAVIAAAVLIPAFDDLDEARWQRDRAVAIEKHRTQRLERYAEYIAAVDRRDENVVRALVAEQLNKVPQGWSTLEPVSDPALRDASVFPALEPEPLEIEPRRPVDSALSRLARDERARLLMVIGGAVAVLIGVLPAARR